MSEGHYNSVPSAEACQLDCQVVRDHDVDGGVDEDDDDYNDDTEACQLDFQVDHDDNDGNLDDDDGDEDTASKIVRLILMRILIMMSMLILILMPITTTQSHLRL